MRRLILPVLTIFVFAAVSFLGQPVLASGKTYYLDAVNGNDGNSGLAGAPWKTLSKAAGSIGSSDTVILSSGIYTVSMSGIYFGPAGVPGNPTVYQAAPGARPIVTRTDSFPPYVNIGDYVRIQGLWFGGNRNTAANPQCFCTGGSPIGNGKEIIGNTFFNFVEGLSGGSLQNSIIQGNRFVGAGNYPTKQHSIYLSGNDGAGTGGASTHIVVDDNIIIGGEGYGIQGWHEVHNLIFTRNFIAGSNWGMVADGSDHIMANNFFWREKGDPGTTSWGLNLSGIRTLVFNNISGPSAWFNTGTVAVEPASGNAIENNAFNTVGLPTFWWNQPQGKNRVILTAGQEPAEIGISAVNIDAIMASLRSSFSQPPTLILNDSSIEGNFSFLSLASVPAGSPLYRSGKPWFGQAVNIGIDSPAPIDQNAFWAAFRSLAGVYGLKEYDQFGKVLTTLPTPLPTQIPSPTAKPVLTPTPSPTLKPVLPGDINKDGKVDMGDDLIMLQNFGKTSCGNVADVNGDCRVDIFDYNLMVTNFGK